MYNFLQNCLFYAYYIKGIDFRRLKISQVLIFANESIAHFAGINFREINISRKTRKN